MIRYVIIVALSIFATNLVGQGIESGQSFISDRSDLNSNQFNSKLDSRDNDIIDNSGLLQIKLPLYNLKNHDITVPIALNYSPNRVTVDATSSWVGLGWELEAGAMIYREVRDLPDDVFYIYDDFYYADNGPLYGGWLSDIGPSGEGNEVFNFPNLSSNSSITDDYLKPGHGLSDYRNSEIRKDLEPDLYTIALPNEKVQFVFDEYRNPRIIGNSDVKISYRQQNGATENNNTQSNALDNFFIESFKVIDGNGVVYEFEDIEYLTTSIMQYTLHFDINSNALETVNELESEMQKHPISWRVSKIQSPIHTSDVQFTYSDYTVTEKPRLPIERGHCITADCSDRNLFNSMDELTEYDRRSTYRYDKKQLTTISTENETIHFLAEVSRTDQVGGKVLNKIEVKNTSNSIVQAFKLNSSFVTSNNCTNVPESTWCNRLFLDGVDMIGQNEVSRQLYSLTYNGGSLPPRYSYEQDFWGFYNDNNANSLIPKLWVYPEETGINRYRIYPKATGVEFELPGADRSVNPTAIITGLLSSIENPYGGLREFNFEPNRYYDPLSGQNEYGGGLRIQSVTYSSEDNSYTKSYTYNSINDVTKSSGTPFTLPVFAVTTGYMRDPTSSIHNCYIYCPIRIDHYASEDHYYDTEFERWDNFTKRNSHTYNKLSSLDGKLLAYEHINEIRQGGGRISYEYHPMNTLDDLSSFVNETWIGVAANGDGPYGTGGGPSCIADSFYWGNVSREGENIYPFVIDYSAYFDVVSSKLKKQSFYNNAGNIKQSIEYFYIKKTDSELNVSGLVSAKYDVLCQNILAINPRAWIKYNIPTGVDWRLGSTDLKVYDTDNSGQYYNERVDYSYLPEQTPPTRIVRSSGGDEIIEDIRYVNNIINDELEVDQTSDLFSQGLVKMRDLNMVSFPIETIISNNDIIVEARVNTYHLSDNFASYDNDFVPLLATKKRLSGIALSSFQPLLLIADDVMVDPNYDVELSYLDYNNLGYPISVEFNNGIRKKYDFNSEGLVVSELLDNLDYDKFNFNFDYIPSVGISKKVDANGIKLDLEYDDFNQLKLIKDNDGNVVERYTYHYKNESRALQGAITITGNPVINNNLKMQVSDTEGNKGKTKYIWDFGDGNIKETFNTSISHTYSSSGAKEIKLIAENPDFDILLEDNAVIMVFDNVATVNVCSAITSRNLCTGEENSATNCLVSTTRGGPIPVIATLDNGAHCGSLDYTWSYQKDGQGGWISFGSNTDIVYADLTQVGFYEIKCRIIDACGNSFVDTTGVTISRPDPNCQPPDQK